MRRIKLKVITRAKKEEMKEISKDNYRIKVSSPPEKGRANTRIIELVAEQFGLIKRDIKIVSGETSNNKILEINI
ncbi:DUF167 domain-containing protein [Candidatus Omnitrophota bacterium]